MTVAIDVKPSGQACGAMVTGIQLNQGLSEEQAAQIRAAWLNHHVLVFPEQHMSEAELERFTLAFGHFGDDPFIAPIDGHPHIIAVQRNADETGPIFAEAWHTDWSFQKTPPAGTCLYSLVIPDSGGDTLFANQHLALQEMPAALRSRLEGLQAIHSAQLAYAPDGAYGDQDTGRSMDIRASETAREMRRHPIIRAHPETGRLGIFGCAGYVIGFDGLEAEESEALLMELHAWQTQEQFQYRHRWQENMLVMWDNRSVLHSATGGYEGQARLLHRTTVADQQRV